MSDTFRSRPALVAVAAVMATGLYVGEARASGECAKYGKPTYQADRLVKIGGDTFRSRVYVMGDMEREEIDHGGGRTEVIIVARGEVLSFFPEAKVGMRRLAPKPRISCVPRLTSLLDACPAACGPMQICVPRNLLASCSRAARLIASPWAV